MKRIKEIVINSRGKNRDEDGNPYYAFKAEITFERVSYFDKVVVTNGMTWGNSDERSCLQSAIDGINEALGGRKIKWGDKRIKHTHKTVRTYDALREPEKWK